MEPQNTEPQAGSGVPSAGQSFQPTNQTPVAGPQQTPLPPQPNPDAASQQPQSSFAPSSPQPQPTPQVASTQPANPMPTQAAASTQPQQPAYNQPSSMPQVPIGSSSDYYESGAKPGITLGILGLIFSIIMTPVGFILGIISIVKGFRRGNKALGVLGIASVLLSIVSTIVGFVLLVAIIGSSVSLGPLESKTFDLSEGKITMSIPSKMEEITKNSYFVNYGKKQSKDSDKYVAFIAAQSNYSPLGGNDLEEFDYVVSTKKEPIYSSLVNTLKTGLAPVFEKSGIENISYGDMQSTTISGTKKAYKMSFSGKISESVTKKEYKGYILFGMNDSSEFDFLLGADKTVWTANESKMTSIMENIKVESKY